MRSDSIIGSLRNAGASEELIAAMRCVVEATAETGDMRYSTPVSHILAKLIVRRSYGPAISQLCHFITAVDACGDGNEKFERLVFALGRATPAFFKAYIEQATASHGWLRPGIENASDDIVIRSGGETVSVPYRQMPLLGQLFEFLITTIGYEEINRAVSAMLPDPADPAAIHRAAETIRTQLHQYLADHLPTRQMQRRHRRVDHFLRRRTDGNAADIDDEAVIAFWLKYSGRNGEPEFQTFRSVFRAFVEHALAADAGADRWAMERAAPLDERIHADNAGLMSGEQDQPGAAQSPLETLAQEPAKRIKFLTKREATFLSPLLGSGPWGRRLSLSLLRSEILGGSNHKSFRRSAAKHRRRACWAG